MSLNLIKVKIHTRRVENKFIIIENQSLNINSIHLLKVDVVNGIEGKVGNHNSAKKPKNVYQNEVRRVSEPTLLFLLKKLF